MRFLPPAVRPFAIRFGQTSVVAVTAVLAMAGAPLGAASLPSDKAEALSVPAAPPVKAVAQPAGPMMRKVAFEAPVKGYRINSAFGLRKLTIEAKARAHKGVDIAAPKGTSVYTTAEGRVVRAGFQAGGYGNFIEVKHPNGLSSIYGHLSRIDVHTGQDVAPGERIGLVGSTGYSTGPHLHFEVRRNGAQVNPTKVMGQSFDVKVSVPK
ncbi:M23 family metallopeptidase [Brevundimonas sp. NPDC058933]|uniref:M23 family metallopeptidase n=1 Tax=Brevundimonas sp. NPDC058933 TaxID=3346673 RepID=UPI003BEEBA1B